MKLKYFVNTARILFFAILAVVVTGVILSQPKEVISTPEPDKRLESPWGIPDYNNDPKYDKLGPEVTEKLVKETPKTVNNYVPEYNAHYSENAKAICTSLDTGGLKADEVFGPDEPGSFGHVAVRNYCPHNL